MTKSCKLYNTKIIRSTKYNTRYRIQYTNKKSDVQCIKKKTHRPNRNLNREFTIYDCLSASLVNGEVSALPIG